MPSPRRRRISAKRMSASRLTSAAVGSSKTSTPGLLIRRAGDLHDLLFRRRQFRDQRTVGDADTEIAV